MTKQKNGEIELLRFIFAIIIMIFHYNTVWKFDVFTCGSFGVEFFYIVTGVLLAMSAKKYNVKMTEIPDNTYSFVKRKIGGFFPYYIVVLILQMVILLFIIQKNTFVEVIWHLFRAVPRILLFDSAGFTFSSNFILGPDWYLAAMILATIICFPLLLLNYEWMSKLVFPIVGLFGFGVMYMTYGNICVSGEQWMSIITSEMARGLFGIMLGAWAYEMAMKIKEVKLTKLSVFLLTILKWLCFIVVFVFVYGFFGAKYTPIVYAFCIVGVMLSFSEKTCNIPYNKATKFLGKLSLLIYLVHNPIKKMLYVALGKDTELWIVIAAMVLCPIVAWLIMILTELIIKGIRKGKHWFVDEEDSSHQNTI